MRNRRKNDYLTAIVDNAIRLNNLSTIKAARYLRKWGFPLGQAHRILLKPWMRRKSSLRRQNAD